MKHSLLLLLLSLQLPALAQNDLSDYRMAGPYEVVARDGEYRASKSGSERDMWTAYECARQGLTDKALEIINAYATTLQRFDGHDAPLCCIQGFHLVRAMTLVSDELKAQSMRLRERPRERLRVGASAGMGASAVTAFAAAKTMVRRAILPTIDKFEADSPYANGNWGAIVNRCRMACAIFLEDSLLYRASIDYFLHANDNGSLPRYVSETGQCQETGRDQSHAQLGLGAMCDICEMAWEQGDGTSGTGGQCPGIDLWGALDNRLMKGIEYDVDVNDTGYRYIRMKAIHPGTIPADYLRGGQAPWMYFDEIIIE